MGGGILKTYRKLTDRSKDEIMEADYWNAMRDSQHQMADYFNNVLKDEKDMMNNTKNYTMRHRLNREIQHTEDFRKRFMTKEYGNYEKYDKNRIKTEYKEDEMKFDKDNFYDNYLDMIKKLPTKGRDQIEEKKRNEIHDILTSKDHHHKEFQDMMFQWKHNTDNPQNQFEDKDDKEFELFNNPLNFEDRYVGRMSPFAKEQVYMDY
jgi:hypothetical protein